MDEMRVFSNLVLGVPIIRTTVFWRSILGVSYLCHICIAPLK